MEYFDVLDRLGQVTGKVQSREVVHRKGLWHRSVHIWIFSTNNQILLQKRSHHKLCHPGLWDISCAGHVSQGETSLQAAVKELKEELGLNCSEEDLGMLYTAPFHIVANEGQFIENEWQDIFYYKPRLSPQAIEQLVLQPEEVTDAKWISPKELTDLALQLPEEVGLVDHRQEYLYITQFLEGCDA